jgi:serine protease Do
LLRKLLLAGAVAAGMAVPGQSRPPASLPDLSVSFQTLARRVNASVVKVVAVGYRVLEEEESDQPGLSAKQQSSGSGIIIDPAGYIVTNAHVVLGAQRVNITIPPPPEPIETRRAAGQRAGRTVRADIIGLDMESDVALLKVNVQDLPALRLADSDIVEQGQIVLAFGSPMGLDNSVSMGVISSPARQLKPDEPMIYIQTDAPINPGSSGGPLVDADGNVVGINTLILTQSGGSEGIGFAVPSSLVANVVDQLRKSGRVVRGEVGVFVQTITPSLAAALKLTRDSGVLLADVEPDGAGARAGLQVGDIVTALNGKPIDNARQFNVNAYREAIGARVELDLVRGGKKLKIPVEVVERHDPEKYTAQASRAENLVVEFGIFGLDLNEELREQYPGLRRKQGVLVASRNADGPILEEEFKNGDVIYAVNRESVASLAALRAILKKLRPGDPVAVQIERSGRLRYLSFELP